VTPAGVRVWERPLDVRTPGVIPIPLRFRVVPGIWPDIELTEPEGTRSDVSAPMYELRLRCDPGVAGAISIELAGFEVDLAGRELSAADEVRRIPGAGSVELTIVAGDDGATVTADGIEPLHLVAAGDAELVAATAVTANVSGFRVAARPSSTGRIAVHDGAEILDGTIFGLRPAETALHRRAAAVQTAGGILLEAPGFTVSDGVVRDTSGPAALVPDGRTIVSPIRVVEEFVWRDSGHGDMTRVADRTELWRSTVEPGRFPELRSGFRSVDAAFELALETFQRTSSGEFSLPGETGLWSAGYFQGSGLGFGSWKRDTSHVALRGGNLLDPEVARASLEHVVNAGFDNGSDGDALPAVAVWDHVLATGDVSLVVDTWDRLAASASALDDRFDADRGLVRAPHSTSNDLFDEPEAGGFALSTEIYAMATYRALARMAGLDPIRDDRADGWAARAERIRRAILTDYWNEELGIFTCGPAGSPAFERGLWETSGAEAAVWGHLGAEAEERTEAVLAGARRIAMSEYGLVLYPYREDENHFCHAVWYCWQAGFARAAARTGDTELLQRLIGQQVRTVVLNKTFYEVTDARSGASWRWPGQLWHAAGFASLVLFGVLGIHYDLDGMTFGPAVPAAFAGLRLAGLRYRAATLDVEVRGHGTRCEMMLDGRRVDRVDPGTTGRHAVVLTMAA
jgi:hypothetical protein